MLLRNRERHGVTATDPLTFGVAALLLACIGLVACYIPARQAMRDVPPAGNGDPGTGVDPGAALRLD